MVRLDDAPNSNQGYLMASSSSFMISFSSSKTTDNKLKTEKRKYDELYIYLGFVDFNGSPHCILTFLINDIVQ